jgi:hypothetical protein
MYRFCKLVWLLRWKKKLYFNVINLRCVFSTRSYRISVFFNDGPELIGNGNLCFVLPCFRPRHSTTCRRILMFTAQSFLLKDYNRCEQKIYSIDVRTAFLKQECMKWMAYWSKKNMFILNTSLYIQEDISPWNSRLRRSQVSYLLSLCSYLQTSVINVFYSVWRFRITAQRAFVFLCVFCFVCFRSRSHPVPHRGERVKQGTVHP